MLYQIFIFLFQFSFNILKQFSSKLKKRDLDVNSYCLPTKIKKRIWIHCASAGEYEQSIPLIQKIQSEIDCEIGISFYSASGMEYYTLHPLGDFTFYLPIDTKSNAHLLLDTISPDFVIWVRYEFWGNILQEIFKRKIPSILLYVDLKQIESKNTWERKRRMQLIRQFNKVYATTPPTTMELAYQIIQDGKWSKSLQNTKIQYQNEALEKLSSDKKIIVIGSAHIEDIKVLSEFLTSSKDAQQYHWVILPHEIQDAHVQQMKKTLGSLDKNISITWVAKMGILKYIYQYADIAWIGGGLGKSVHNVLEAAAYQIPIICGPNIQKAHEATELEKQEVLFTFSDAKTLQFALQKIHQTPKSDFTQKIQSLFTKNAVDNYSTSILKDMTSYLS